MKIQIVTTIRLLTCVLNVNFRSIYTFNYLIIFCNFNIFVLNKMIKLVDMRFFSSN